ncbi:hypothetical protein EJ06DRAFT_533156 [Trichodelitschia bisporula]|uniref:Uncharacterized protein n=1 Tax=Trichodelitschia bisporula TaxID=703511 RepID=A0A6G1HNB3_9PEZI|nr:hypothetical protein EJ06DRAFT_533156 [Trichodelitschia bisporula]
MDSMRSLNTSLPSASSPRSRVQPSEKLLQAFKEAALTVTNLYKTAASERTLTFEAGYQEALRDMLELLDKKTQDVQDGDGRAIRQWLTERYHGNLAATQSSSESEEEDDEENRARSSSPATHTKTAPTTSQPATRPEAIQVECAGPFKGDSDESCDTSTTAHPVHAVISVPQVDFSFRSSVQLPSPSDHDMDANGGHNTVQVNLMQRPTRSSTRHSARHSGRSSAAQGTLGTGAGMKRRGVWNDFFDISGMHGKDREGGGKRGRFT